MKHDVRRIILNIMPPSRAGDLCAIGATVHRADGSAASLFHHGPVSVRVGDSISVKLGQPESEYARPLVWRNEMG